MLDKTVKIIMPIIPVFRYFTLLLTHIRPFQIHSDFPMKEDGHWELIWWVCRVQTCSHSSTAIAIWEILTWRSSNAATQKAGSIQNICISARRLESFSVAPLMWWGIPVTKEITCVSALLFDTCGQNWPRTHFGNTPHLESDHVLKNLM